MPLSEKDQKFYERLKQSPLLWGFIFCPEHFRSESAAFHMRILKASMEERYLAVVAPREFAKSTVLTFLRSAHGVCMKMFRFILFVQENKAKARRTLETVRNELTGPLVKASFHIELTKDSVSSDGIVEFRHPDGFKTQVMAIGAEEQMGSIRGEKFGAYRPDLIIGDDMESDKMVKNPDRRREFREDFDNALIPCGEKGKTQYIFVGTILHDDCQIAKLVSKDYYPEYKKMFYQALNKKKDGSFYSLWPEKWSVGELQELERTKPDVFAREYQNDPSSGIYEDFRREDFRYWRIENGQAVLLGENSEVISRWALKDCKGAIACDLAWEEKREADSSVILPAYLTPAEDVLVDDYISKKGMRPDEIEETLFAMEARMEALTGSKIPVGFEKAKLEKVVRWLLDKAMRRRKHFLWLKDLKWDHDKITRIVSRLSNRYRAHAVFHKRGMGELEQQLCRIRSTAHDDVADALQGVLQVFEYPKIIKKQATDDDGFEKLRKFAIESQKPQHSRFIYGKDKRIQSIRSTICPI